MSKRGTDDASSPPRVVRKKGISEDDSWWTTTQNIYLSQADVEPSPSTQSTQSSLYTGNRTSSITNDNARRVRDQGVNNSVSTSSTTVAAEEGGGLKRKFISPITQGGSKKCNTVGSLGVHQRHGGMDKLLRSKFKSPAIRNDPYIITTPSSNNVAATSDYTTTIMNNGDYTATVDNGDGMATTNNEDGTTTTTTVNGDGTTTTTDDGEPGDVM